MRKKIIGIAMLLASIQVNAQTWDGSDGTDWNTPANWSTNAVPTATGNVTIPNTANKPVLSSNVTVASLSATVSGAAINFNGFTLTVNGGLTIRNTTLSNSNTATDISITVNGSGTSYLGGNIVNDNISLQYNSTGVLYEGYLGGNTYNGNFTISVGGSGTVYTSFNQPSTFNGNLSYNRTVAGLTDMFNNGFANISGNFSYTNNAGGDNLINSGNINSGNINGTINITVGGTGNPQFWMRKIKNLTSGGSISVQNSGRLYIERDTLRVTSFSVTGFTTSSADELTKCDITGNLIFSEAASNTGSVYVGENVITGTTTLGTNANTTWYAGYQGGCIYNGNTSYNLNGSGTFYSSYNGKDDHKGNLTVQRTGVGITDLFNTGFTSILGNFSYTNNAGGNNFINSGNNISGAIAGSMNINVSGTGNPQFIMRKIKNLTGGGLVSVANCGKIELDADTLNITSLSVTGITGSSFDQIQKCVITGNVSIADDASNSGAFYVGETTITGNTTLTSNAPNTWYESYLSSDVFIGNVTFVKNNAAGTLNIAFNDTTYVHGDLTFNSTAGFDVNSSIEFAGTTNSVVEQLGTQPISIPRIIANKSGNGFITFNDSVTVTTGASFLNGLIYTSVGKELIFPSSVSYTGASASSHIVGPVIKIGAQAFVFPVGSPNTLNTISMTAPVGAASRFRATYILQNPSINGLNTNNKAGTLSNVSNAGYWQVERLTGVTNVNLTLAFGTNPYHQFPALANLKVAQWNGSQWDDKGNSGTNGTAVNGTITHTLGSVTSYTFFALANQLNPTYFYAISNPGTGPDGTPVKVTAVGGYPTFQSKQLPAGNYSGDSIYLLPNGGSSGFKLRDAVLVEKDDTTVTLPAAPPTNYVSANATGTVNFSGWRHFVYVRNASNEIIGALRDNNLTLGNTTMQAFFASGNVALAPNGQLFLKRSFRVTAASNPAGTKRLRLYISKTEFNNLVAADPTAFPNGINSLHLYKYTGTQEDALFNPRPGGVASIIQPASITKADLGTMYSLDIDVTGFSGFYFTGANTTLSICPGSTFDIPSNITGASYQWQVNSGSGFTNLTNGVAYSGVTTATLSVLNAASSLYGYQYRCLVNGGTPSQTYTVKFSTTWQGTANNVWENPANWPCGVLPDANTDIIITAGKPNYPQIGANTSVRTLKIETGTNVTVKPGFRLTVIK